MKRWYFDTVEDFVLCSSAEEAQAGADEAWDKACDDPEADDLTFKCIAWGELLPMEREIKIGPNGEVPDRPIPPQNDHRYYSLLDDTEFGRGYDFNWHDTAWEARREVVEYALDCASEGGPVGKMEWGQLVPHEHVIEEPTVPVDGGEPFNFVLVSALEDPAVPLGDLEREIIAYAEGYAAGRASLDEPIAKWHEGRKEPS